jgi:hypothetical protein
MESSPLLLMEFSTGEEQMRHLSGFNELFRLQAGEIRYLGGPLKADRE